MQGSKLQVVTELPADFLGSPCMLPCLSLPQIGKPLRAAAPAAVCACQLLQRNCRAHLPAGRDIEVNTTSLQGAQRRSKQHPHPE